MTGNSNDKSRHPGKMPLALGLILSSHVQSGGESGR